jgi:hypothetical protein
VFIKKFISIACEGLPRPRSSNAMAAEMRVAAGARGSFMMAASVQTAVAVCDRANDRIFAGALVI